MIKEDVTGAATRTSFVVVLNWTEELKQRVPTRRHQLAKTDERCRQSFDPGWKS
jgi:hypothetical protein